MEYKLYQKENYNLHFLKTDNFKTISLSIRLKKEKTQKDDIYAHILKDIFNAGSNNYKKINDYYRAKTNIYNPGISFNVTSFGKEQTFFINSGFADEKYTEKGMNEKTIEFIFNVLYNPKLETKTFKICKNDYIKRLKSAKNDPFKYASNRLFEEMDIYDFKSLKIDQSIELAQKLTLNDIKRFYESLFTDYSLDIFVTGDFDFTKMQNTISKYIHGNFQKTKKSKCLNFKTKPKEKEITETINSNQSQLGLGYKFINLTDFERKYVSVFYVSILGGNWNSKLFQTIREKNSLCYFIRATRSISHGMFAIKAAIDQKDYEQTLALIKEQVELMKKGDFTESQMEDVRQIYSNCLLEMEDNQKSLLNNLIDTTLCDNDDIDTRRKNIKKVTKEDIIKIAKKAHLEVVYLLKGVNNEKTKNK